MSEIPYGYCHCGCGQKTKLANWTDKRTGAVKGEPYRYLNGHSNKVPVAVRFWSYVEKKENGCWEWIGTRHQQGYGLISSSNNGKPKTRKAHRLSWEIHNGPIPMGLAVLHKCDNTPCCNPDHLFLGTQDDNMKDCAAKGRLNPTPQPGEQNPMAALTDEKVKQMRQIRKETGCSYKKLAFDFSVSTMTAFRAVTGQSWSHLEG